MQESVILLDSMSDEEDTIEDNDAAREMEAKERTELLMSMSEYRSEIYGYLRKSEVMVISKFVFHFVITPTLH